MSADQATPHSQPLGDGKSLADAMERLAHTIDNRAESDTHISYTAKLLGKGPIQCGKKLGEEAVELALAIAAQSDADVVDEAADVVYHLLVALKSRGIALDAVGDALHAREGRSGLEEKARRPAD